MKSGLFAFILLSTLVHAVIISMQDEWVLSLNENHEQGSSFLNIELLAKLQTKTDTPARQQKSVTKTKPAITQPIQTKKTKHATIKQTPIKSQPVAQKKNSSAPPAISNSTHEKALLNNNNKKTNNSEKIKSLLNNELAKHFYYPKAAQRKNRQGQVILAFTINHDGMIQNIHVNKSSGSSILDKAAIKALNKIDANEDLAKAIRGQSVEQILPITYKLTSQ
jgi:TonB family protein